LLVEWAVERPGRGAGLSAAGSDPLPEEDQLRALVAVPRLLELHRPEILDVGEDEVDEVHQLVLGVRGLGDGARTGALRGRLGRGRRRDAEAAVAVATAPLDEDEVDDDHDQDRADAAAPAAHRDREASAA